MKHSFLPLLFLLSTFSLSFAAPAPVPQTGQTLCYSSAGNVIPCTGTGQDGDIKAGVTWPYSRFNDNGNGTVNDNLTGLIWSKDANPLVGPNECNYDVGFNSLVDAVNHIACLNANSYLGYSDWSLPSGGELNSLVDSSRSNPVLPVGHLFNDVSQGYYWSISGNRNLGMNSGGLSTLGFHVWGASVWPVRRGELPNVLAPLPGAVLPSPRYIDNGDGSVTDNLTGLTWLKNANCFGPMTWNNALAKANTLLSGICNLTDGSEAGDWHMPNRNEIWSHPDSALFSNYMSDYYWSSTTVNYNPVSAFASLGGIVGLSKESQGYLWPVRTGRSWPFGALTITSSAATDFGVLPLGTTSTIVQLRLRNAGASAVVVSSIGVTGADPSQFTVAKGGSTPCASLTPTLEAGAACTVLVTATPTSAGSKNANLTLTTIEGTKEIPLTVRAYSTVLGTLTDQATNLPVSGATITLNTGVIASNSVSGTFSFDNSVNSGTYSITISKAGYQTITRSGLSVTPNNSARFDGFLPPLGLFNITSNQLPSAVSGEAYLGRVMVTGGTWPYTFSKAYGDLPAGLSLDTTTGIISGTPTGTGNYTFAIGVNDNAGGYSEHEYTIYMATLLEITTVSLPRATKGSSYPTVITASGGKSPNTFAITGGTLPTGLSLLSTGSFTGSPNAIGNFPLTITVTDSTGRTASRNFTLNVDSTLIIATTSLNDGLTGTAYSQSVAASGGYGTYAWSILSGTLPAGLSFDTVNGIISGTPSAAQSSTLVFKVQDGIGRTATKSLALKIGGPLTITTASFPEGYVGTPYSNTVLINGGISPFQYSLTGVLPEGLSFNTTTGTISGTPTAASFYNFAVTVTDNTLPTHMNVQKSFSIRIHPPSTYPLNLVFAGTGGGSVNSDPSGINCTGNANSSCPSYSYPTGTIVTLYALPDATSTFAGWSAYCAGTGGCSIIMDSAKTLAATFNLIPKVKLDTLSTSGYDKLVDAYTNATDFMYVLAATFTEDWMLNGGKNITLTGGYLADYGPTRSGFTILNGKLSIRNGSLRVDGLKLR